MNITSILPMIAAGIFICFGIYTSLRGVNETKGLWMIPAILSFLFLAFSLIAITSEGVLGFWSEHITGLWGNQIWFDLLFAVSIGWFLIIPQAKALGMRLLPWFLLVASTGCIGFLAMLARLLYLRERVGEAGSLQQRNAPQRA